MAVLAFDIGGSAVKYGVWDEEALHEQASFPTPKTWEEMKEQLLAVKEKMAMNFQLEGVAFSAPGAVNQLERKIDGLSAVPYLHHFPIYDDLEDLFGLAIAIENDANSAALAEVWNGAAKDNENVLFVVIGTGVGGSVIVNREVQHGAHLFGGEFGLMLLDGKQTFSELATPVQMSWKYADRKGISREAIDGKRVFELAEEGDKIAIEEVDHFFYYLAIGLYNLTYSFDPEKIIIGGGVSNKDGLIDRINKEFEALFERVNHDTFRPVVEVCEYKNDANLVGAVYNFQQKQA
ncbi:MAG: ROK family protein [Atopostipes suicloacalis]|nr:ROK family protein [Atopostipes suicloacalis]MDN6731449.1 ROK family protein [Atopostipes suicloacalis]